MMLRIRWLKRWSGKTALEAARRRLLFGLALSAGALATALLSLPVIDRPRAAELAPAHAQRLARSVETAPGAAASPGRQTAGLLRQPSGQREAAHHHEIRSREQRSPAAEYTGGIDKPGPSMTMVSWLTFATATGLLAKVLLGSPSPRAVRARARPRRYRHITATSRPR